MVVIETDLGDIDVPAVDLSTDGELGRGVAKVVKERTEKGVGLMNVDQLLQMMNKAGKDNGAEVVYKRRDEDSGDVTEPTERDKQKTNFDMQMTQLAKMVSGLPTVEKLAFAAEMRRQGNERFSLGDYDGASELYMHSLVGLDFGDGSEAQRKKAEQGVQVPVLTNLAACALKSRNFGKCVSLCDAALELDANAWKAHGRKGVAYRELGEYGRAREALRAARASIGGNSEAAGSDDTPRSSERDADLRVVRQELRRLHELERRHREASQKTKKALQEALGGSGSHSNNNEPGNVDTAVTNKKSFNLYGEKKNIKTEEEILAETEERRKRSQRLTGDTADPAEAERVSKRREELYGIVTGPDGMKATSVTTSSTLVTSIAVPAFVLVLAMTFGLYREMAKLGMLPDVLPAALGGGQRLQ